MEFKGTKTKWNLEFFNGKGNVIDIYTNKEIDGDVVAQVYSLQEKSYNEPFNEEMKANALLISKAPEMLEMLKVITDNFPEVDMAMYTKEWQEKIKKAKQLIEEATNINKYNYDIRNRTICK